MNIPNTSLTRREFIRQVLLVMVLATPVGSWLYQQWLKSRAPKPDFTRFALPLVRRVFPQLTASELVSVQPMQLPTGLVFFMDYEYHFPRRIPFARNWPHRRVA